jgi:acyl carrier protein
MLDARLVDAISEVFGLPREEVNIKTGRETIREWDSLGHLRLILRVEEVFRLRFPSDQIPKLISAAEIQEEINRLWVAQNDKDG